ncbi:uncharacterized protein SPAPADRAFT_63497 [Spathaspora passalidarum NRRL Y-27907]|uniref:Uncharacterized protein n=1 Tax=Spathaspora passalidarum (strain NRRL Y-27907 / 11-Y1) TaxID=619300 RepID=G3AV74_SPAPN|nr:uncharacterized protein SPAPADRAFT_63497 [Spathaspora passalidarum NRRL Y-27907]EGW29877.1 hypothetical protein SPAPADRAFT_63497 [Spathaspora passalidarum NRRL Y-27907]
MFKSIFQSIKPMIINGATRSGVTVTATPATSITIYHNTNSLLSHNLLSKLSSYSVLPCTVHRFKDSHQTITSYTTDKVSSSNGQAPIAKFDVDVKFNQGLSKTDYDFIMNECVDIHPDNQSIMLQLLYGVSHDKRKLIKSFDLHDELYSNFDRVSQLSRENGPLIIDYNNKLIANDEASFDRIMVNYLSCGIQNVDKAGAGLGSNGSSNNSANLNVSAASTIPAAELYHQNLIHPHVAEFADLF